jgi:ATP-dependent DNA helicase RecG
MQLEKFFSPFRVIFEAAIEQDSLLGRWPLMQKELEYRYQRLMGGTILT